MIRLYELQGKQLPRKVAVPVPEGDVASTPEEAMRIAGKIEACHHKSAGLGLDLVYGRFKAGGIKFGQNPEQAEKAA